MPEVAAAQDAYLRDPDLPHPLVEEWQLSAPESQRDVVVFPFDVPVEPFPSRVCAMWVAMF
jgi:hypothetical protein